MPDLKPDDVTFHEETDSPTYADDRNFYKVEKWTRDAMRVDSLFYAGNSLSKAQRTLCACLLSLKAYSRQKFLNRVGGSFVSAPHP